MSRNEQVPQIKPVQEAVMYSQTDDEISLIDLIKILIKRKTTLFIVFAVIVLAGLVAALMLKKQYQYSATIEIGTRSTDDDTKLIDSPSTLLAKIQNTYALAASLNYQKAHPSDDNIYKISASIPKDSTVIVLDAKGGIDAEKAYKEIMNDIIQLVVKDHDRLLDILRKEYQLKIEKSQNTIDGLINYMKILKGQEERLEENKILLAKQIKQSQQFVNNALANRAKASRRVTDETRAMTLLMIDNEIQQERSYLDELEEKLTVTMANKKDDIEAGIDSTQRKISENKLELSKIQLQLQNLQGTHSLVPPIKSIKPVNIGRRKVLLLAVILGVFISLFAAFMHEFIMKVRDDMVN